MAQGRRDHQVRVRQLAQPARFDTMLRNVYLPEIINGSNSNGNWELTMVEAAISISVYLERHGRATTRRSGLYLTRVPAYVYLASDGALPKTVPQPEPEHPGARSSATGRASARSAPR